MKKILFAVLILSACNQAEKKEVETPAVETQAEMGGHKDDGLKKRAENKTDPTCGMPVSAGVSDTLHYDGHVLGFCSPDCKTEFAAHPTQYKLEYKP